MTVRELLDTCALAFNTIEIHRKGMIIFDDNPENMTEFLKGLKVKSWEPYEVELVYEYKYNIDIYAE